MQPVPLRDQSSRAIRAALTITSPDSPLRYYHYSLTNRPGGLTPIIKVVARLTRPAIIEQVIFLDEQLINGLLKSDILISRDDRVDLAAPMRDTHMSGTVTGLAGFIGQARSRSIHINYPITFYPSFIKILHDPGSSGGVTFTTDFSLRLM